MPPLDADVPPRPGADHAREPAGILRRSFAMAIDLALALCCGAAVQASARALDAAAWIEPLRTGRWLLEQPALLWSASFALPAWLALSWVESLPGRASPGKRALGLRVDGAREDRPPSFARLAVRTAIKLVPWHVAALAILFPEPWNPRASLEPARLALMLGSNLWIGIYLATAAMTRRRQSLHDLATGTVVVSRR